MSKGLAVTGTDTGVGKTMITRALVSALCSGDVRVAPMKPIETGSANGNSDSQQLRAAARDTFPLDLICPEQFPDPLAPLMAARRANRPVDMDRLDNAFHTLQRDADLVIVEGAGGLMVPISETENYLTLFQRWSLDVLVVAPNRLGVINHTLLTIDAARAGGLRVTGVILNDLDPQRTELSQDSNAALIAELRQVPVWTFPHITASANAALLQQAGETLWAEVGAAYLPALPTR